MKKQFLKFIPIAFFGMIASTANAGNNSDSTSQGNNNTNAIFRLVSIDSSGKDGIKGKLMISGGFGFNALRPSLIFKYGNYYAQYGPAGWNAINSYIGFTPIINLGVDYGLAKRFSVGMALGYQQVSIITGNGSLSIYIDTWTRIQLAVRGDYYIIANDKISLYTGLKVGYNNYNVTTTRPDISIASGITQPSKIAIQAHVGYSYYFNKLIGINTEVALAVGGPDYFALGITFRL